MPAPPHSGLHQFQLKSQGHGGLGRRFNGKAGYKGLEGVGNQGRDLIVIIGSVSAQSGVGRGALAR